MKKKRVSQSLFLMTDCLTWPLFVRQRKGKNFFNFALEAVNGHPHLSLH
ncbi:hypothetical protein KPNJ2_05045 [Klebsiella pneumoniae 30684/NJST258_2]|uniref:Uncharacterized protein n=1 Tax=Klebsiella pneumoniae 30684/NJST258_2 TaxID=1420013 RepID=W8V6I0_KLEPN|nr:hypothetical protein KPNJ2_05045 [Klebsiella pneumoniae 30684/NJST258_2]